MAIFISTMNILNLVQTVGPSREKLLSSNGRLKLARGLPRWNPTGLALRSLGEQLEAHCPVHIQRFRTARLSRNSLEATL